MTRFMRHSWFLCLLLIGALVGVVIVCGTQLEAEHDVSHSLRIAAEGGDYNPNTWLARGELARQEWNLKKAEEAFLQGLLLHPGDPNLLNNLGLVLIDQGRYDEAVSPLQEAISKKPYAAPFYLNLGSAYALKGNFSSAAECFEQATVLSPQYLLALHNLGLAQMNAYEFEKALPPLLDALQIDPANGVLWINLGITLSQLGYLDDGIFALDHALALSLSDPDRVLAEETRADIQEISRSQSEIEQLDSVTQDQIHAFSLAPAVVQPEVLIPSLHPPKDVSDVLSLQFPFSFNGIDEIIEIDVHRELYLQAQGSYKAPLWNDPSAMTSAPSGLLYLACIHDPVQKPIIEELRAELHQIMEHHPDRSYLELIAAFVYSLAPDAAHTELRYPVESLVDKAADCDDRSTLAAAVLLEDGYDVAIITFPTHVVFGVRPSEWDILLPEYRNSGYSVIDLASYGELGTLNPIYDAYSPTVIPIDQ